MNGAIRCKRNLGWMPVAMGNDGEPCNVQSEGPRNQEPCIEVKGHAQSEGLLVTNPGRNRLQQLGERARLCTVTCCKGEQSLWRTIQDPFSKPTSEMLHRQVPDFVKDEDWARQGWEVETAGNAPG